MKIVLAMLVGGLALTTDGPTPREWAAGLGSAKPEERHATIDAIESRGLLALPTLREIAATVPGEPRAKALELIERIGTRRLLRPTFQPHRD